MSLFKFFHSNKDDEIDIEKEKNCIRIIKQSVSEKCGISDFIDYDDFTVAFAGSKDNMQLMLEICTQKYDGKKYLYASIDDEISWQEWDFDNLADFEETITDYIAKRVNKTIKCVVDVSEEEYKISSFYLNENDEWIRFEEYSSNNQKFCFIMSKIAKSTETIKNYKLEV